jgi:hypothetical protein
VAKATEPESLLVGDVEGLVHFCGVGLHNVSALPQYCSLIPCTRPFFQYQLPMDLIVLSS